jgi:plastocyanin
MMKGWRDFTGALLLTVSVAACGGSEQTAAAEPAGAAPAATAEAPSAGATGQVIEVRMTMTNGGRFEPETVTANPGDVIRFVNVDNVHNISFPQAKNAGFSSLPAASPYLTAPGQTWDLVVDLEPGTYTFQCDPHVPMGMFGTLTVQ